MEENSLRKILEDFMAMTLSDNTKKIPERTAIGKKSKAREGFINEAQSKEKKRSVKRADPRKKRYEKSSLSPEHRISVFI